MCPINICVFNNKNPGKKRGNENVRNGIRQKIRLNENIDETSRNLNQYFPRSASIISNEQSPTIVILFKKKNTYIDTFYAVETVLLYYQFRF